MLYVKFNWIKKKSSLPNINVMFRNMFANKGWSLQLTLHYDAFDDIFNTVSTSVIKGTCVNQWPMKKTQLRGNIPCSYL